MARLRPASPADYDWIASWTQDTFDWGDYVPTRFHAWLEDEDSELIVCVDTDDRVIAMANVVALTTAEAWIEAARVHPDHRRQGLGTQLNHAGVEWARERGARVMRLSTEAPNLASVEQVKTLGYRPVCRWFFSEIPVGAGHRSEDQFRLRSSPSSEAEAAWMAWSRSQLAKESREMIALGWRWRGARPQDLLDAAQRGEMFHSAAGWATAQPHEDQSLATDFLATTPEDILRLLDGLVDLAVAQDLKKIKMKLPDQGWTREAVTRLGGDVHPLLIWAKPI